MTTTRPVRLHPLVFLDEGEDVTIGRRDIDSYVVFPADGARAVERLAAGSSPDEVGAWYAAAYGVELDVADLMATLAELDFVVAGCEPVALPALVRWQRLGRAVFSPLGWAVMAGLVALAGLVMASDRHYRPHVRHLFFTDSLLAMDLALFAATIPLIIVHESFHVLAGRRLGLNSSLSLGWRAWFLVVETHLDGLVSVPRRSRYLPMLAGMVADTVMIAALTLGAYAADRAGAPQLVGAVGLAAAFGGVLRLVWQLLVFMRTDVYYLIATVFQTVDVHAVARARLADDVRRLLRLDPRHDPTRWHPRDLAVSAWYRWVLLGGFALMASMTAWALIPALVRVTRMAAARFADPSASWWLAADAALFIVLNLAQFVIPTVLGARRWWRVRHSQGARS
ncbi:MAG: hypothetical protein V9G19_04080 [Tetrasphaera sp.]